MDDTTVRALERHWEDGWNSEDLDLIMEPMAPEIVFSSPFVERYTGDPAETQIQGFDALRVYLADALRRKPGIRYALTGTYVAPNSLVLTYTFTLPEGITRVGADFMRLNADNKITDWSSQYPVEP